MKYKLKECRVCQKEFKPFKSTEQVCSYKCAIIHGKKKVARKQKIEWKKDNDLQENKAKLQRSVNELARVIDYGLPCLARGYHPNQMHGGHIFSRGAYSNMRYNLHNIHRQSAQSNHHQNEDGLLRDKLKEEYGTNYYQSLESLQNIPVLKYTASEYYGFYLKCNKLVREYRSTIKKTLPVSERIRLRNEANLRLGIYPLDYCTLQP